MLKKYPMYIYKITHIPTMKHYIGITNNPERRLSDHLFSLKSGRHHVSNFQKDFDEYGGEIHFTILEKIDDYSGLAHETFWQYFYGSRYESRGYNYGDRAKRVRRSDKEVKERNDHYNRAMERVRKIFGEQT